MEIIQLYPEDILPLTKYKSIFYDIPPHWDRNQLCAVMYARNMQAIGVKSGNKLLHASWTFRDERIKKYVPLAKEIGNYHATREGLDWFWEQSINIFMSDGTRELFGFALSINKGQARQVEKMGGRVYKKICRFICGDGVERDIDLNVLTRAGHFKLKHQEEYDLETYKLLLE